MSGPSQNSSPKSISAEEIIAVLDPPSNIERNRTGTKTAELPLYELRDKKITGRFDLRHRIIKVAIDIQGCVFSDDVDLRYCEFLQNVNVSDCCFEKVFNSGDGDEAFTIFHKDLICSGTTFLSNVSFQGLRCEGSGIFRQARFVSEDAAVDFSSSYFGNSLDCAGAVFKSGPNFNNVQCKVGASFQKTQFENVDKEINFVGADWGKALICNDSVFKGGATFNSCKCELSGYFNRAKFECEKQDVNFDFASFEIGLEFCDAIFKGGVTFKRLKCGDASDFQRARFENAAKSVNFSFSHFGMGLKFDNAIFNGGADFSNVRSNGCASFKETKFENVNEVINFRSSCFGTDLELIGATFKGGTTFNSIKCDGLGNLDAAVFNNQQQQVDFSSASFQSGLNLTNATFSGGLKLDSSNISEAINLSDTKLPKGLSLYNAHINRIKFGESCPFISNSLDLRECIVEGFDGTKESLEQFVESQQLKVFSRDPYVQIEKFYQKTGNDVLARQFYYKGRCGLRTNAKREHSNINWSKRKLFGDWLLKWLTGYGSKSHRLFIWILAIVFIGVGVFWKDDALKPKPSTPPTQSGVAQSSPALPDTIPEKVLHRLSYSVELFVPVLKLDVADKWQSESFWRQIYTVVHRLLGWVLIPLLVASIAGALKKE